MYNQESSMEDFLTSALKDAKLFLSSKKTFSIEEVSENALLQKALCKIIVDYWKNPKAQENFMILFVELPEEIAFDMLSSIAELINEKDSEITEEDKKEWCNRVTKKLSKNMDIVSLSDYTQALYLILNGEDISNFDYGDEFRDVEDDVYDMDSEEDNDESEDSEDISDQQDEYIDDEYQEEEENYNNRNDRYRKNDSDGEKTLSVIEKKLFPRERRESAAVEEKIDMNPTSLATLVLSGKNPNRATQMFMIKNKSFAKAYANALSLQTVITDLQSSKKVQERFMSGLEWLEDDIFQHAWQTLFNRRQELSPNWSEKSRQDWIKAIERQRYSKEKSLFIFSVLGWKKQAEKPKEPIVVEEPEKPNPYSRISKYYYENGKFEDGAFDEKIDDEGMFLYAKALAVDAYPHWNNPEKDTLELYAEAVRFLDIAPFEIAIQTLVETFEKNKNTLTLDKKKEISYAVLQKLADSGNSEYDNYRETLINAISGYNKMIANQKKEEKNNTEDENK